MFRSRQRKIQDQIFEYCQMILDCMDAFQAAVEQYCDKPDRQVAKNSFAEVHKTESRADDIRREIETVMYSKALFPESRGDILGLLETMDRVPNQAESAILMIWNQHVVIPQEFHPGIRQLVQLCVRTVEACVDAVRKLFTNYTSATIAVGRIDQLESEADKVEADLIERLFAAPPDPIQAILLRDLINHIATISDRAENVGDRIRIAVAKRTI